MSRFAQQATTQTGVDLVLIGEWADLAAYYAGSDGNAYSWSAALPNARFSNHGEIEQFRANFSKRFRGKLFA